MVTAARRPLFRRIDHIGVIVDNLAEARRWMEAFGLPLRRSVDIPERQVHGEFYAVGDLDIELIEIGNPEERRRRLGDGKRARIEHIAVEVDDLGAATARVAALGGQTTAPTPRETNGKLNFWTVEETTGGISYQLVQRRPKASGPSRSKGAAGGSA